MALGGTDAVEGEGGGRGGGKSRCMGKKENGRKIHKNKEGENPRT